MRLQPPMHWSLCVRQVRKRTRPRTSSRLYGDILGFGASLLYGALEDVFREDECSFRHRRTTPEKLKAQIRAHRDVSRHGRRPVALALQVPSIQCAADACFERGGNRRCGRALPPTLEPVGVDGSHVSNLVGRWSTPASLSCPPRGPSTKDRCLLAPRRTTFIS